MSDSKIYMEALKSDIRAALANKKAFACPIAMRVAWHASGTYDKTDGTGGSDGATMRFEPEISDEANEGLLIVRDMLHEVKEKYPELSEADVWTLAGSLAIEFMGGPEVPHRFGRVDDEDGSRCPAHGRLPDASQGAEHLREVFYRMGFNDRDIVALSGGHTVGRCHKVRSGYDGAWTHNSLEFDNSYFKNLVNLEWKPREWDGEFQYTDTDTETLVMLPTDMALIEDDQFRPFAELYARDQEAFFEDFKNAYARLMALGCPEKCDPFKTAAKAVVADKASAEFREFAMHGSVEYMRRIADEADVHGIEESSGRNALHKAAFWGHEEAVRYLVEECKLDLNVQDFNGDTALHDAARFDHQQIVQTLLAAGADAGIVNHRGKSAAQVANDYKKPGVVKLIDEATREPVLEES